MKAEKDICHPKNVSYLICDLSLLIRCTVYWMTKHGVLNHILDANNIFSFSLSLNWLLLNHVGMSILFSNGLISSIQANFAHSRNLSAVQ